MVVEGLLSLFWWYVRGMAQGSFELGGVVVDNQAVFSRSLGAWWGRSLRGWTWKSGFAGWKLKFLTVEFSSSCRQNFKCFWIKSCFIYCFFSQIKSRELRADFVVQLEVRSGVTFIRYFIHPCITFE